MIKLKSIRPLFTKVVTTARTYGRDQEVGGVVTAFAGTVMPIQRVLYVGSNSAGVKPGDLVCVNPEHYGHTEYDDRNSIREDVVQTMKARKVYSVPRVELNGVGCFLIETRDIDFVVEEWDGDWEADAEGGGVLSAGIGSNLIV